MNYRWRWEFQQYDHRRYGVSHSRGFLHYIGAPGFLLVLGFHRGIPAKPQAWLEFTFYSRLFSHAVYPGVRIPRRWL